MWPTTIFRQTVNLLQIPRALMYTNRYSLQHYTTIMSLSHLYKEGGIHTLILFMPNSDHIMQMPQQKQRLIRQGNISLFNNFCDLQPIVFSVSYSYVAFCYQNSLAARFDALCIHRCSSMVISIVKSGYLRYCCLSVNLNQSGYSPLISFVNKGFPTTELLENFFYPFSVNPKIIVH